MLILVFIISFIVTYISIYIITLFSGEKNDPISVLKTSTMIWGISLTTNLFNIEGLIGLFIYMVTTMILFIKILGFEPMPSMFAAILFTIINSMILFGLMSFFS